jgi:hypothetical protein
VPGMTSSNTTATQRPGPPSLFNVAATALSFASCAVDQRGILLTTQTAECPLLFPRAKDMTTP